SAGRRRFGIRRKTCPTHRRSWAPARCPTGRRRRPWPRCRGRQPRRSRIGWRRHSRVRSPICRPRRSPPLGGEMAMTRRWLALAALVLTITVAAPQRGLAQGDPVAFINDLGTQAIQVLGKNASEAQRLQRFRELFASRFDIPGIGQFVLGRYWRVATPQEQQDFLKLLNEYLAQAYSGRLREYAGEPFRA